MKKRFLFSAMLLACTIILFSYQLPEGWIRAGSEPQKYDMGIDEGAGRHGKNAATIKSISSDITGFGTLMQNSLPDKYLGKRVRMSGYMKSENVADWAGFWFRVDRKHSTRPLAFDNMHDRAVTGTTGWEKYEIVLDVPDNASNLAYGTLLSGTGEIWFSNLKFEIVDRTEPTTGSGQLKEPENLNFEN